jgi:hypothetical protein
MDIALCKQGNGRLIVVKVCVGTAVIVIVLSVENVAVPVVHTTISGPV